uniref:Uncharacterized protein n=1 Tax=Gopherus agassizii TaxID=38772 RepID=A0A452HCD5_9SAUR
MTGPGMVLLLPFIDHWQLVDLRTRAFYNPGPLSVISMGADIQFRVWDAVLSVMMVKDLNAAIRMMAQNAMTKTLLKKNLREIQTEKLRIGDHLLVRVCLSRLPKGSGGFCSFQCHHKKPGSLSGRCGLAKHKLLGSAQVYLGELSGLCYAGGLMVPSGLTIYESAQEEEKHQVKGFMHSWVSTQAFVFVDAHVSTEPLPTPHH